MTPPVPHLSNVALAYLAADPGRVGAATANAAAEYGLPPGVSLSMVLAVLLPIFAVTFALRALPFAALRFFRESTLVAWLGLAMPVGVMSILVMYTVIGGGEQPGGLLAVLAALVFTVVLHLWRRSATLSILLGTLCYAVLVNLVF